jgi:hypothetical protein
MNPISINQKLSKEAELLIFDSEELNHTALIIKYLPLLSKHFSKNIIYSGNFMMNFWIKVCAFFPNIKILPLQNFKEDYSHYGVIINCDEYRSDFKQVYDNYLVINLHKTENFQIIAENKDSTHQDKLSNLCALLNLDAKLLDDRMILDMINHFYHCDKKNDNLAFLLDNSINQYLFNLVLNKKQIPHVMIKPLQNHIKHRQKDMYDFDTILIIIKNAGTFYTDNTTYYEFFSHPILKVNTKSVRSALDCLNWLSNKK